jgi:hypothetical protein
VLVTGTGTGRRTGGCRPAKHALRHADKNTDRADGIPAATHVRASVCHARRYHRESDQVRTVPVVEPGTAVTSGRFGTCTELGRS